MRQNSVAHCVQLLKYWLCDVQLSVVMEKNWVLSLDQCQLQAVQFLMHLIDLLSILLRWNGFSGIQKAVVDETDSRSPKAMTFIWLKFGFENCFVYSSQSSH